MKGYWKRPSIETHAQEGWKPSLRRRNGHICFGPLQFNWGYTPGLRVYLTWPGRTRTLLRLGGS